MKIPGSVALVSGANRGLGRAYVDGLLRAGARRVYAAARDPATIVLDDPRIVPIRLDVTLPDSGRAAASLCPDVTLLINNAGVLRNSPALGDSTAVTLAAREEMETNFFGVMSMVQAFAPLLAGHGGGAIVNVLSVASWFSNPFTATYSASKAAAEALTDGIRIQLRSQGTQVVGVYAGFIDTDMAAHVPGPKTSPGQVVERTLQGVESGIERVFADDRSVDVDARLRTDRENFYADLQGRWDEAHPPA